MQNKKIIAWASAGAIIIAGVGGASVITAHNLNKAQEAEQESSSALSELLTTTQPAPSVGTTAPTTTKQVSVPLTTKKESGSKTTAPSEVQTTNITWAYDAELSRQVANIVTSNYSSLTYDATLLNQKTHPEYYQRDGEPSSVHIIKKCTSINVANELYNSWQSKLSVRDDAKAFCIEVYKSSDGYYFAVIFFQPTKF